MGDTDHISDEIVLKNVLQGDREAFGQLVTKYQQMIFRTCVGFVHNEDDANDLTQEVFVQAFLSIEKFRGESSFPTWLYRIAVNASLVRLRKNKTTSLFSRIDDLFQKSKSGVYEVSIPDIDDPETIIIREEHKEWVRNALDQLPENQKTAIVLSKYDELSQKEIAQIMQITEGAVEALLVRAKANLRKNLLNNQKKK